MVSVLRHTVFRRLFLAQVVALAGTGLATVALSLLAYRLAPSAAAGVLGTALAVKMLAYVFVAPVATAAVARFPRRAVLVGADLMRAAAAMVLPFVTEVWQVYALVFLLQAASATFTPTFQSVIPDILPGEEEFTAALSLSRLAYDLESVLSPMLAAALLLLVPASALFFGTGAGFVAGDTAVALLLAANGAGSMLVALALPRLLRSVPERPVMLVGLGVDAAAWVLAAVGAASTLVAARVWPRRASTVR